MVNQRIVGLTADHAGRAAQLHIDGQPGTFLTSLGPEVLTVLYRGLPTAAAGFGFGMVSDDCGSDRGDELLGFVSATTSVGRLFVELGFRQFGAFLPPLTARLLHQPDLLWRGAQTVLYPLLVRDGEATEAGHGAELLSIMVDPALRGQGIGGRLLERLLRECAARRLAWLNVTVDETNDGARRFYAQHGFEVQRSFHLYGRPMCQYRRQLSGDELFKESTIG